MPVPNSAPSHFVSREDSVGLDTLHTDNTAIRKRDGEVCPRQQWPRVFSLDVLKSPEESEQGVRDLGECKLLAQADPGAAAEGDILPASGVAAVSTWRIQHRRSCKQEKYSPNTQISVPSLRSELVRVGPKDVFAPVQGMQRPTHRGPFGDENGLCAVFATAAREDGFLVRCSRVGRHGSVQTQRCGCISIRGQGTNLFFDLAERKECIPSLITLLRYFMCLSCSQVGPSSATLLISSLSFATAAGSRARK